MPRAVGPQPRDRRAQIPVVGVVRRFDPAGASRRSRAGRVPARECPSQRASSRTAASRRGPPATHERARRRSIRCRSRTRTAGAVGCAQPERLRRDSARSPAFRYQRRWRNCSGRGCRERCSSEQERGRRTASVQRRVERHVDHHLERAALPVQDGAPQLVRIDANASSVSASTTIHDGSSSSASSWPAPQPE